MRIKTLVLAAAVQMLGTIPPVKSQAAEPVTVSVNFWNMDVKALAEALASEMGKVFVVDASLKTRIYWRTETPLPQSEFYDEFVRVLQAHKLAVVEKDGEVAITSNAGR